MTLANQAAIRNEIRFGGYLFDNKEDVFGWYNNISHCGKHLIVILALIRLPQETMLHIVQELVYLYMVAILFGHTQLIICGNDSPVEIWILAQDALNADDVSVRLKAGNLPRSLEAKR